MVSTHSGDGLRLVNVIQRQNDKYTVCAVAALLAWHGLACKQPQPPAAAAVRPSERVPVTPQPAVAAPPARRVEPSLLWLVCNTRLRECFPDLPASFGTDRADFVDLAWNGDTLTALSREGTTLSWDASLGLVSTNLRWRGRSDLTRVVESFRLRGAFGPVAVYALDTQGQLLDPSPLRGLKGVFFDIAAGTRGICGVRMDGSVSCESYALPVKLTAPSGPQRQITLGGHFACALSVDDRASCWWLASPFLRSARHRPLSAPDERFLELSAGATHVCGLTRDHSIRCWGDDEFVTMQPPSGSFAHVASAGARSCALDDVAKLTCWGSLLLGAASDRRTSNAERKAVASGALWRVCHTDLRGCFPWLKLPPAVRVNELIDLAWSDGQLWLVLRDGTVHTTNRTRPRWVAQQFSSFAGDELLRVAVGGAGWPSSVAAHDSRCGINTRRELRCESIRWEGEYVDVAAGANRVCALRSDGRLMCDTGSDGGDTRPAPAGDFKQISISAHRACALTGDGRATCWNTYEREPRCNLDKLEQELTCDEPVDADFAPKPLSSPAEHFSEIATGDAHTCGIVGSGSIVCWGDDALGQTRAPSGAFEHIAAVSDRSCASRRGGGVVCWGAPVQSLTPAPPINSH